MKKRFIFAVLLVLFGFVLAACTEEEPIPTPVEPTPTPALTAITFSGISDETQELEFEAEFNVLTGVTALGNDGVDYTDQITYVSTSAISETHMLDTSVTGNHAIRYEVKVGTLTAQKWRYITVKTPEKPVGELLANGDMSQGTAYWADAANGFFIADGAAMEMTAEDGALKVEVVAGSNPWTPRFGQMLVPFEEGKTYEVSFDAKSTVEKVIQLQAGELLASAPWFTNFTVAPVRRTITTDWATYSYEFTHTLDNPRGGILFEMGTIDGVAVDATLWFDNVTIEEVEPSVDEEAPTFGGLVAYKSVLIDSTFDPLAGVTASDNRDGNVTEDITVVIKNALDEVVTAVDTSAEGIFTLTYTVSDAAGNEATYEMTVEVVGLLFSGTNLLRNPSFATALDTENPEWVLWSQNWGAAPVIVLEHDVTGGTLSLDITGGGDASWAIQLQQPGVMVEEGKTYRLQFDAFASVARAFDVVLGYGDPWNEYARAAQVAVGTEEATYEFLFTVTKPSQELVLKFELGSSAGFADGVVTFTEVRLEEAVLDEIVTNGDFSNLGWQAFHNDWEGSVATLNVVDGEFKYELTKYVNGSAGYLLQWIYGEKLVLEAETTYVFSFDAYASKALDVNPFFTQGEAGGWNNLVTTGVVGLTTTKAPYSITFTTGTAVELPFEFKLEFGTAFAPFETGNEFLVFDNLSLKKDVAEAPELLMNGDATTPLDWTFFTEGDGQGTMMLEDGALAIEVTGMAAAYQPHLYQMIGNLAPGNYVLKFVIESDVTRDLRVNLILPDAGYASILPDSKYDFEVTAAVEQVVVVEFEVTNEVTNVKFELDFGVLGGDLTSLIGNFVISEIMIYQNFN